MRRTAIQSSAVETQPPQPANTTMPSSSASFKSANVYGYKGTAPRSSTRQPTSKYWHPPGFTSVDQSRATTIPSLREALNSLETQMSTLMSQRQILESKLEQAVRLQSPIQRLPNEIIGTIFAIGVLQMGEEDSLLLSTLMLVCRSWTEVALNTPILWSRIVVGNHDSLTKALRKIERSKSVPLDVCIHFSPRLEHAGAVTEAVCHAMDILRPTIWRWRSFRLAVPNRPQAHAALTQCKEEAPLLEELAVQVYHFMQDDYYSIAPLPLFHGQTPRLRSCSFTSFNFGWDRSLVSGLRVLNLGGYWHGHSPAVSTILSVLRECPSLEEFSLRNMSDVEPESCTPADAVDSRQRQAQLSHGATSVRHEELIVLPHLKKASFYYAGIVRVSTIFSQLQFPALERIEFAYMDNLTPILKHLKRQSFTSLPLRHMRVETSLFNEFKLLTLLKRLPTIETLELVDVEDVSSNFLQGLSSSHIPEGWIIPSLETLNLDGCTTLDWDALRSLVDSRLPHNASRMLSSSASACPLGNSIVLSSASSYAQRRKDAAPPHSTSSTAHRPLPKRLKTLDITRCHQISKEMAQWLRMYVPEVRCETSKGIWADTVFP